jgi:ribonuclease P protein component
MSAIGAPGFQLPKNRRLICSPDYQSVIAHNCWSKDALFIVYAQSNGQELGRLGITVSRRVAAKAVERNRIKRAIRESFRHQQRFLAGLDIVTIARKAIQEIETKQLFVSLDRHWRKVDQKCRCAS